MNFADTTDVVGVNPDKAAFEAAIRAEPEDDNVRLVYADWLDEHEGAVRCPKCKGKPVGGTTWSLQYAGSGGYRENVDRWTCSICEGIGSVANPRAEFIRVQVELAKRLAEEPPKHRDNCKPGKWSVLCGRCEWLLVNGRPVENLRQRERELWKKNKRSWWKPLDDIIPGMIIDDDEPPCEVRFTGDVSAVFARGFVAEVRCPLAAWMGDGETCDRCKGDGRIGGHYDPAADDVRGDRTCPDCHGSGRTPGIAKAVCGAHPVTAVRLIGKEPFQVAHDHIGHSGDGWTWFEGNALSESSPHHLPSDLFRLLDRWRFDTPALAHAALSAAALAYGKGKVK